jgi:hypothetical protein
MEADGKGFRGHGTFEGGRKTYVSPRGLEEIERFSIAGELLSGKFQNMKFYKNRHAPPHMYRIIFMKYSLQLSIPD